MLKKFNFLIIILSFYFSLCGFIYVNNPHNIIVSEQKMSQAITMVLELIDSGNYEQAMDELEKLDNLDTLLSTYNSEKFNSLIFQYKKILVKSATGYIQNNEPRLALNLLNSKLKYYRNDENILSLIKIGKLSIENETLVDYDGKIEHLFIKSLLAYPDKALDTNNVNYLVNDLNHITPHEFKSMLNELYKNNYILIDINSTFKISNGNITLSKLRLPANKKPIILSFEDISAINENGGKVDKIILDRNNEIATYTSKKSINIRVSYDNEYVTILENFIQNFPDFSHNNAKGVICLSGYDGILGYKTQKNNATSKYEIKKAKKVVAKLKNLGWKFACDGYTQKDLKILNDMDFTKETSKWKNEIEPIVSSTHIYSYSFGSLDLEDKNTEFKYKQKLLKDNGFNIFLTLTDENSKTNFNKSNNNQIIIFERKLVSGQNLRDNPELFKDIFNNYKVYDYEFRKIPLGISM